MDCIIQSDLYDGHGSRFFCKGYVRILNPEWSRDPGTKFSPNQGKGRFANQDHISH